MIKLKINTPRWAIIHHEAGNNGFESVNRYHRNNPKIWLGVYSGLGFAIAYHYYIDKLGKIYQGRLDTDEGAHTIGMNTKSVSICLQGNFNEEIPTEAQENALRGLLVDLTAKYNIPISHIVPHRKFSRTDCFGLKLPDNWAQNLLDESDLDESDRKVKIDLLIKQISLMEKLLMVFTKILSFFKGRKNKE